MDDTQPRQFYPRICETEALELNISVDPISMVKNKDYANQDRAAARHREASQCA